MQSTPHIHHHTRTLVRVVSLVSDVQRRAEFSARASETVVRWTFFDALTNLAPDLHYDNVDALIARGRPLSGGELGCYSSHYTLWRELVNSEYEQLLVLEDDILLDWRFVETIVNCDLQAAGIGYLRLFAKAAGVPILRGTCLDRYLYENVGYSLGTQAYLLTRGGAQHLLAHLNRVSCPIDDALDKGWRGSLPTYSVFPHPVIELAGESRIGVNRHAAVSMTTKLRLRRLIYRVADKFLRITYQLQRRLAWRNKSKHVPVPPTPLNRN
ncbi:MAG: glycosyltransferase family 25 protein [Steroidobacteraceae bacterium]